jgi:hypothetical protein
MSIRIIANLRLKSTGMKRPAKSLRLTYVALLAAGLAIGFLTGWQAGRRGEAASGADLAAKAGASGGGTRTRDRRVSDSRNDRPAVESNPVPKAETKDFAESVRHIFRETVPERRRAMFESMLERADVEHYAAVVSLIRENDLRGSDSGDEWTSLWSNWGRRDPVGAFEYIRNQDWSGWDPLAPDHAKKRAITTWAQSDPEQARRFFEDSGDFSNGDRTMVAGLVGGWAAVDPKAAAEWLFESGRGGHEEYKAVVESISRKGGREALDNWFSGLDRDRTPTRDKNGLAQVIAQVKQEYEPEKAAAWVEQHLNEPWLGESEIVDSTARAFASRDPKGAMEWAQKTGLESATTTAMGTWCQQDLPAASAWLRENSTNPAYSPAATLVMDYLQQRDPMAAKTWAESLPDQTMRRRLLDQLKDQ